MKNIVKRYSKIRWGHLNNTNKNIFESKIRDLKNLSVHEEADVMWKEVASNIKNITKDMLRVSKEKAPNNKNSWWCNQNMQ